MSGSLLEDKENVAISHEFAKEDPAHITSSILKPSQKQNVGQLTPKKPPKVTFKNTPLRHHPIRYKVEQPGQLLDTWEEIRYLDEEENWTERTQVVTKEDHQLHLVAAKEILDYIIDTLPCFNSPKKEVKETTESCEQKDTESAVPIEIKAMDESLDLAGPLDPAIASLNSLLKAGEDEERAFSPIGSGKVSPDCDNMVTSDDIEKLLSPHVMPEEMDIPSLELFSSNRIDAFMDSTFSGKHLDEVAAKLNKLKLSSTTINGGEDDFDLPIKPRGVKTSPPKEEPQKVNDDDFDNLPIKPRAPKTSLPKDEPQKENDDDFNNLPIKPRAPKTSLPQDEPQEKNDDDFDNLPIKPRAPKTSPPTVEEENKDDEDIDLPLKPRGAKIPAAKVEEEKKDNEEMKENGNEEENLPVKRRQPKAVAPKKDVQPGNDEDETFKKPMPPKPWKTKKKKAPQNEDPFAIMFAEPAKGISSNEKSAEDKPHSEQKPVNGEGWEGMSAKQKVNNENHDNTTSGVDGVVFSEQQDDFGFTNDDFQTGNDFSLELDYLEKFGNSNNLDRLSALARQSLYVKFDPLCKGRSPDQQALQRMTADANALKQTAGNVDDLLLSTPPSRRAQTKLTSIKESDGRPKTTSDLSAVDKLLTFSPVAKDAQPSKPVETKRQETTSTQEDDGALVQPLLYSKSDIEVAVKKEREALLKQTHEESQFREMEIQDILSKLQTEVEKNSKLKRENDELKTVMKEYEKTMAEMIESTEKDKNSAEGTKNEIVKERDQLQADLNSVEAAFSDLHRRYEKMKGALENFKKNEEILKKAAQDYQEKLRKSSEKYQMLKKHAEEKIETANIEINRVRRSNDSEMAVMRAALKKEQNKCASLEQAIQQKINENKELTAICDELIQRASSK